MAQHKWHKEIKAWADGAEIERWYWQYDGWGAALNPNWDERYEYRIKPQPKEQQYLYVYMNRAVDPSNYILRKSEQEDGIYIGKIKLEVDDD
jgi:hypothetical protein